MLFNLRQNIKKISPKEVYTSTKVDKAIVILDVREEIEYRSGYINGAINLPVGQIKEKIAAMDLSKDTKIIIYCQSGARSTRACSVLENMGYNNLYNLGGIMSWPYEIVK
ncbi:rhodanese-like domain-containing protein [Cellulosilyticum sp. I15G10I2]|uniref:rhodanese-like domain-containing protein n=1 Tax=Cellulosilyticum sp. I15G10I2 TaxID=1892843 RepID=UPI00085CB2D2|nr:rhodanese-like domain-containing protein [Cellulosilyticum sp. I15G10I2]